MAQTKPEFDKRNVRIIGLSVDPVEAADIKQGVAPDYPMIDLTTIWCRHRSVRRTRSFNIKLHRKTKGRQIALPPPRKCLTSG